MLIDTHCHIHDREFFPDNREAVYQRAIEADVAMLCVGTSQADSRAAVEFAGDHENTWAVVGVHPHDAKQGWEEIGGLLAATLSKQISSRHDGSSDASLQSAELGQGLKQSSTGQEASDSPAGQSDTASGKVAAKIVGVGEIGLDYFYDNSPRDVQIQALEQQLQWAVDYNLPVIFHVREASSPERGNSVWRDFWPIFDNFPGVRGVLHSFTDTIETMEKAVSKGLFIGVNGISTFARDKQAMYSAIPLEKMLLETDAPFLTPVPKRGTVNEPAFVKLVAEYHANLRTISLEELSQATTRNATTLFKIQNQTAKQY